MKTKLIKIGNSKGVRIPKPLIKQSGIGEEIEMILEENQIVIRSASSVRKGWDSAFQKMHANNDDSLIDGETISISEWDSEEWEW